MTDAPSFLIHSEHAASPWQGFRRLFSAVLTLSLAWWCAEANGQTPPPTPKTAAQDFGKRQNRLARETSPYLRQHASNPVDWYPWGPEALQKALKENKPIFLSIGYSTCFWCHVMEREVFENEEIAAFMNQNFVNIKVDREERPDIDEIYMTSLQVYFQLAKSSQGGGWPLSIFLTPDGRPIAGGTYFPAQEKPGMTPFPTVLRQIDKAWKNREADVRATADLITREVARLSVPSLLQPAAKLTPDMVTGAIKAVEASYDPEAGGFDFDPNAPEGAKFPVPCKLALLQSSIGHAPNAGPVHPAEMLDHTLERMAMGGIRDHLGGGFHRYSTDRQWHVPHFEKMLYDNAQLAEIYVEAYRRTGRDQYRLVAEEIFSFVKRELTGSNGEFFTALDAETDGVEGVYYAWTREDLEKALPAGGLRIFSTAYGLDKPSALEIGHVLYLPQSLPAVADTLTMPREELQLRLQEMRGQLFALRQQRPAPRRDDKVLTGWNGLMIRAFARGGQILKRQDYLEAASKAAVHLLANHRDPNGGLLRTASEPNDQQPAFLEDYAYLVSGLLALYDATREDKWLNTARKLTDDQIGLFWDQKRGGFFFTAHKQEVVLARLKNAIDNVMPSGNSVAAQNLVRLARLKTDESYRNMAEKTFLAFSGQLQESPDRSPYLAMALQEYLHWYGTVESHAAGDGLFAGGLSAPNRVRPMSDPAAMPAGQRESSEEKSEPVWTLSEADAARSPHVKVRGFLNLSQLPRGGTCPVAFEFHIEPGWHLNANPPKPEFVTPLNITLAPGSGVTLRDVRYPAARDLTVNGIQESLAVYEGKILIHGTLEIPQDSPDLIDLNFQIQLQACNTSSCLPKTLLTMKMQAAGTDQSNAIRRTHDAVFDSKAERTIESEQPGPSAKP